MKFKITFVFVVIFMLAFAGTAYADSYDPATETVIIDTPWTPGTLSIVITGLGADPNTLEILTITNGTIDSVDSNFIGTNLPALRELRVTGSAVFPITTDFFLDTHPAIEYIELPCLQVTQEFAYACPNLQTVILNNTTDFLGVRVLSNCTNLITLTTPALETIGGGTLWGCTSLTTISMPNLISVLNGCLAGNDSLTTVNMPLAETFGNGAFRNCDALTSLSLPSAVSFGDDCVSGNLLLTNISLPNAETFGESCLTNNDALTSLSLPSALVFGRNAINGNDTLQSVSLPVVTTFGIRAFQNSDALTSVYMPMLTTMGNFAFNGSTNLVTIELDATTPAGVGPTTFAAYNPSAFNSIVRVPINQVDDYDAADGIPDDDMWYGWTIQGIVPAPVSNPQTGDLGLYIPYNLIIGLLAGACLVYGFMKMNSAKA